MEAEEAELIGSVSNCGDPIELAHVPIVGISAGAAAQGESVPVWPQLGVTSDEFVFHSAVPGFCGELSRLAAEVGVPLNLEKADSIFLRVRADRSAQLWVDSVATSVEVIAKRAIEAGQPVFSGDIADVVGMRFPAVDLQPTDGLMYLFRRNWRFGLYYDLRLDGSLDLDELATNLAAIYRNLSFRHLYDTVGDSSAMEALVAAGWFPFVDIAGDEFHALASSYRADIGVQAAEGAFADQFGPERIDRIRERWLAHPILGDRRLVLGAALDAFNRGDHVSAVKTALTEIEGILNDAHRRALGRGAKLGKLLEFVANAGVTRARSPDTLLFPQPFRDFLTKHTFAQSDARQPRGVAGSRHSVGHGSAGDEAYTRIKALQAILTVDQLVFFL